VINHEWAGWDAKDDYTLLLALLAEVTMKKLMILFYW
jgi:hypothetical protein